MLHTTLVPIDLESSGEFIFIRYHDFCNMGGERLTLQVEQTIWTLSKEGNSYSVIVKKLKAEGLDVGKATICRVVNGIGKKREAESNGQKFQVDRPRPVRTPATVSKVKRLATTENPPSQRQLSRMCGTSLKTINNIIHKDLELDTRRKGKVHKLTPFHMKNRATNARKLYEEHLAGSRSEYTATLDEAWMYVTYCNGIRKICYIKRGNQVPDNWVHQCSETFPKGFMVVGVMTGRGVLPLIKVPSKVKVNSEFYIECVLKPVIEQLKDLYPGEMDKVFLHHDKASSHTSNKTQQFLQEMKDTLGLNFIRNSDIPVKSPDASPLDFYGFENVRDSSSLDDVINLLGEEIFHTCLNTIPSRPRSDKYLKSISWWKSDLNPLKRATQKAQRAFIKARGVVKGVLEVFYKRLKARYRRARRLAKKEAWRAACSRCEISPWGGIYSFIKGNFKRKPLSALPVGSGFTESPRDTLNHVLDYYFGRVPPDTMLEHKDLSKVIASSSDDDPLFTDNELLLTADKHVVEVCAKVRGMLPRLTAAANLNFGFGYRALRTLYLQVVVPAIAYASAAEALGLVKALENATTLPNHLTLGFFLDNLSVVKSVLNSKTGLSLKEVGIILIRAKFERLTILNDRLILIDDKIKEILLDDPRSTEAQINDEMELCETYSLQVGIVAQKVKEYESKLAAPCDDKMSQSSTSDVKRQIKLPKFELKKYTGPKRSKMVRVLLDSGSQKSYIRRSLAKELDLPKLDNVDEGKAFKMEALEETIICGNISPVETGPRQWELDKKGITLTKVDNNKTEIDILIGGYYYGQLLTGKIEQLAGGLTAIQTVLGWTLIGNTSSERPETSAQMVITLLTTQQRVASLWELETIGIRDPTEVISEKEKNVLMQEKFHEKICRGHDGRYPVSLPWEEGIGTIPNNLEIAEKVLTRSTQRDSLGKGQISHLKTKDRLFMGRPFEVTGVHLMGPLYLKNGQKIWITLFTCAVYRAVHLELVEGLDATNFIMAMERFIHRRGRPVKIYSDNGTNFKRTNRLFTNLNWDKIARYSCDKQIRWIFIPPSAPWWGGWWERIITIQNWVVFQNIDFTDGYVTTALLAVICLVGLVGNAVVVLSVVRHSNLHTSPNIYILGMALGDLLVLIEAMPFLLPVYLLANYPFSNLVCKITNFFHEFSIGITVFSLVALSFNRYQAIAHPMRHQRHGYPRTLIINIVIWILSTIIAIPNAIFSHVLTRVFSPHHYAIACVIYRGEYPDWTTRLMILIWFLFFYAIPLIIIAICNIFLAIRLNKPSLPVTNISQQESIRTRIKISKIVIIMVIIFAFTMLPKQIQVMWFYFHPTSMEDFDDYWNAFKIFGSLLSYANSSLNPIILYFTSGVFKSYFKKYLCCDKTISSSNSLRLSYRTSSTKV
ncbi:hypothetical protein LAZ67_13002233 [Cordylochernes scorpioides]|uniref:G-protein coupled receptors family 1 profile domain-containing protein n=1 Tax=Cordylochernes scorpioides TaxID=51811 RepID=A0ABY6L4G8_9ARAC|nr:hypothetical protein LAZ67_13002233 [Cordylochernes scorpioides]